jgi:hypothetical protein
MLTIPAPMNARMLTIPAPMNARMLTIPVPSMITRTPMIQGEVSSDASPGIRGAVHPCAGATP